MIIIIIVVHYMYVHMRNKFCIFCILYSPTLLPVEYDEYWCDKHNTGI